MTHYETQMHAALVAAERVLSDLDTMLRNRYPTLPMLPELLAARRVLALIPNPTKD